MTPARTTILCVSLLTSSLVCADRVIDLDEFTVRGPELRPLFAPGTVRELIPQDAGLEARIELNDLITGFNDAFTRNYGAVASIRGVGNTKFFSSHAIALYIDGVPQGDTLTWPELPVDLVQARVFEGPQGTSFGSNAQAGAVILETRQPGRDPYAEALATVGDYGRYEFAASAGVPVGDVFAIGVSGFYNHFDGFISSAATGDPIDDRESKGGTLKSNLRLFETLHIDIQAGVEEINDGAYRLVSVTSDPYVSNANFVGETSIRQDFQSVRVRKEWDGLRASYVVARRWWELAPFTSDNDLGLFGSFPDIRTEIRVDQEQWTHELRLEGGSEDAFSWLAGLFFSDADESGFNGLVSNVSDDRRVFWIDEETTYALFGEVALPITERFRLAAGVRGQITERSLFRQDRENPSTPIFNGEEDYNSLGAMLGLEFLLAEKATLFARLSRAFKPGGFSPYSNDFRFIQFDEETLTSLEVGGAWETESCFARATLFAWTADDYQVERSIEAADGTDLRTTSIVNAQETHAYGLSLASGWQIIEGLVVSLSGEIIHIEFDDYFDPVLDRRFDGNAAPFVPEFSARAQVRYQHSSGFFGEIEGNATGRQYFSEDQGRQIGAPDAPALLREEAYATLDLRAGWENDFFSISAFVRNATDEEYFNNRLVISSPFVAGIPGEPTTIGITLTASYGAD